MSEDKLEFVVEEYKSTSSTVHHYERMMWQLLSIHLAMTGVMLSFWVNVDKNQNPNAVFVLFIPALLGIFTFFALLNHRMFWHGGMSRLLSLEKRLKFKTLTETIALHRTSTTGRFGPFDWAILAVLVTVFGLLYIMYAGYPAQSLLGFIDRSIFIIFLAIGFVVYVVFRFIKPALPLLG